ncbi:MAG TPA: LOG family protein [Phycisphaerales bacterium]|nr:LOG family protein [Phycisphaerales bacterium]
MNGAKPEIPHTGFEKGAQMSSDDICQKASRLLSEASRREATQASEMIETVTKLLQNDADLGQLKLINSALKEMRYSYDIFNKYKGVRKVSIFGSARTPEDHEDYLAAHEFGRLIAEDGWMSITGAGDGIMKAGHAGPTREASFGLRIRLPFETTANDVIEGDPKLINFRYFFTRKLMFVSHSDAIAVFPGGFGTQDELFESLTLMQTGKSEIVPVVLVEGEGGNYWEQWQKGLTDNLLEKGWISPEDPALYHIAPDVNSAVEHVLRFYRRFHSSRYVGDRFVMRLKERLRDEQVRALEKEFGDLVAKGGMEQSGALKAENTHLELPRLHFHFVRRSFARLRMMIDRLNEFPLEEGS